MDQPDVDQIRRDALESIRRLNRKGKKKVPKKLPQAPSELWPGESYDLGGWTLASSKRKAIKRMAGGVA